MCILFQPVTKQVLEINGSSNDTGTVHAFDGYKYLGHNTRMSCFVKENAL